MAPKSAGPRTERAGKILVGVGLALGVAGGILTGVGANGRGDAALFSLFAGVPMLVSGGVCTVVGIPLWVFGSPSP